MPTSPQSAAGSPAEQAALRQRSLPGDSPIRDIRHKGEVVEPDFHADPVVRKYAMTSGTSLAARSPIAEVICGMGRDEPPRSARRAEDVRVQRREPGVTDDPNLEHRSWPTEEGHTLGPN